MLFLSKTSAEATFHLEGREHFIDLFCTLAKGFPPAVLHNRRKIPIIDINGDIGCGKSLAVETMMRTWIDSDNLVDLYAEEKDHMFLEGYSSEAYYAISKTFNVAGRKTSMTFQCNPLDRKLLQDAKGAVQADKTISGGIIFGSRRNYYDRDNHSYSLEEKDWIQPQEAWINMFIAYQSRGSADEWLRDIDITVRNPTLLKSQQFMRQWQKLPELTA